MHCGHVRRIRAALPLHPPAAGPAPLRLGRRRWGDAAGFVCASLCGLCARARASDSPAWHPVLPLQLGGGVHFGVLISWKN